MYIYKQGDPDFLKEWDEYSEEKRAQLILSNEYFLDDSKMSSLNSGLEFTTGINFTQRILEIAQSESDIEVAAFRIKEFLFKNYPKLKGSAKDSFEFKAANIFYKFGMKSVRESEYDSNPHLENRIGFQTIEHKKIKNYLKK